ncbi:MAG: UDP-4-amino-4,6-dideoxy-N-acetyl-beta-L-altrosamine transaminase [Micropepsaceae bacterium]
MTATAGFLPYGRHVIDDADIAAVVEALKSDYLTTGPRVRSFETALSHATGARHAIACTNGTAALHLAARALNLGPGTVSIVPAVTFLATASAVRLNGGDVVFSDVDPDSGLMRPRDLEEALSRCPDQRADAVFNVHLAGQTGDLPGIFSMARHNNLRIVEDACHALGTRYSNGDGEEHLVGSCRFSDLTCFSFHPVKTIAMGEGGAVTVDDPALAAVIIRDRTHGMNRDPEDFVLAHEAFDKSHAPLPWYYEMEAPGLNYRIPDVLCALGESQLKKLDSFSRRRREIVAAYDCSLATLSPHVQLLARTPNVTPAWHLYVLLIDFEALCVSRANVMRELTASGIGTQVHYLPVYRQPYYRELNPMLALPGADEYYRRTLSLPLFPSMSDDDPKRVVDALRKALKLQAF